MEISHSPTPAKKAETKAEVNTNLVSFPTAIQAVIKGKRITKEEWNNKNIFGELKNNKLQIHLVDGQFHDWVINDGDLLGEDWIILGS